MLAIQKFLQAHPIDWEELLTAPPFNLQIRKNDKLVIFNYNLFNSDFDEPIVNEARGLILEEGSWKVVRMAFYKFFNLGEPHAAQIDWDSATATSKEDGSIVTLYYYNNKWNTATNGCINAEEATVQTLDTPYQNYQAMFDDAAQNSGLDISKLDPDFSYTFELVSPYNRIVVEYKETKLFHILTRNNKTLEECDVDIGIEKPKFYALNDREAYFSLVSSLGKNHEGVVIKDKYNNRVKLKTQEYIQLHYLAGELRLTVPNAIYIVYNHEQAEFLQYRPECKKQLESVEQQLLAVEKKLQNIRDLVEQKQWQDPKEVYDYATANDPKFVSFYTAAIKDCFDKEVMLMKNCNYKKIQEFKENYAKVKQLIEDHQWQTAEEAFEWALKNDSRLSPMYPEVFDHTFDDFIKKLKKAGTGKLIEKFNIHL